MITLRKIRSVLKSRFGGLLKAGSHQENGQCCALELLSVCKGIPWTDSPEKVGSWDLRCLNDIEVSDEVRAKHLAPVIALYSDSMEWSVARQKEVATKLAILTVNNLIAELPDIAEEIRIKCREAKDLDAASDASDAARSASYATSYAASYAANYAASSAASSASDAASYASDAASSASSAASDASYAARDAAREKVFITACQIWIDAAK